MEDSQRIPVLDGVRGIAVLLVMLSHFIPDVAMEPRAAEWIKKIFTTGGWVGVDLFFVLSGFLITGILLKAKGSENYFLNFYMRRVLRIFPLYYGALAIVFIALPALGLTGGASFEPIRETQFYHWLFLTNAGWWALGPDAFASDHIELRHFWSLAVEEHFYLVWPSVILLASLRTTRGICIALMVSALAFRCLGLAVIGPHSTYYYMTFCRWDTLAAGALIAILIQERGLAGMRTYLPGAKIVFAAGTAFLAVDFLVLKGLWASDPFMRTGGLSILAAVFATGLFIAIQTKGRVQSALSSQALRFFGKYSYGLYIIHGLMIPPLLAWFPIEQWMGHFPGSMNLLGGILLAAIKVAICTLLAMASWHLYEKQFLKQKKRFSYTNPTQFTERTELGLLGQKTSA